MTERIVKRNLFMADDMQTGSKGVFLLVAVGIAENVLHVVMADKSGGIEF